VGCVTYEAGLTQCLKKRGAGHFLKYDVTGNINLLKTTVIKVSNFSKDRQLKDPANASKSQICHCIHSGNKLLSMNHRPS